jgi:hypothetical protein
VLAAFGETWPPGHPDAASTRCPLGRVRLERPICTQAVEMHDPSADGPCQSANDIDGHDKSSSQSPQAWSARGDERR